MSNRIIYAAVVLAMASLQADEIYVTSAEDSGAGSFRAALQAAQPADFIVFDPSLAKQTILLQSDLPPIGVKLNIIGPTSGNVILDGDRSFRLLNVLHSSVAVSNMDLLHADSSTPGGTLFVDSNSAVSLSNITLSPGNNSVFVNDGAQITADNISILPQDLSRLKADAPHTFMLFSGSHCTISSDVGITTPITATGSGNITTMGSGQVALDTMGDTVDFSIHAQEGTLLFKGNSTQPIVVSSSSVLRGSNGCLYLSSRGRVKTGQSIGTSTIIGDLIEVPGSVLEAEIAPSGASDRYLVGGNANLAGNLFVLAENGVYFKGDTFTFLTTDGVVNGVFDSTSTNAGGLNYRINYFPQSIQIEILQNLLSFDGYSSRGNAAKVYSVLANAPVTPNSDLAEVITLLNALNSASALESGLNTLQPSLLGGLNWNEAAALHHLNGVLLRERGAFCGNNCLKNPVRACCPPMKKNGLWISALGERLQQGTLNEMRGFKSMTYGGLIGYDRALSGRTSLGMAGGYTSGHLSWNGHGGKAETRRYTGALYLASCLGRLQVDLSATGNISRNAVKRTIHFPGLSRKATSNPHEYGVMGHLGAGCLFVTNHFKVTPFISGEYFYTKTAALKEHGAASLNLRTKKFHTDFIRGEAGIAVGEEFCTSWGIFSPALSLSYVRFSSPSNTHIRTKFSHLSESFSVKTTKHAFNEIAPAASLGFAAGNNIWISATYEGEFAKKRQDQAITFNLRGQF